MRGSHKNIQTIFISGTHLNYKLFRKIIYDYFEKCALFYDYFEKCTCISKDVIIL